ncbi:MAG TPA: hypothetical protein VIV06_09235 [Candidatus Limnocylindrales bacterium]
MERRISVVTLPSTDSDFARTVEEMLDRFVDESVGDPSPEAFEARLRATFANVRVRPRDPLAAFSSMGPAVWYVHRESVPTGDPGDGQGAASDEGGVPPAPG